MAYTTINKSTDQFITHLYTGNDSTNNQTSLGMTPDLVWVKCRNNSTPSHYWVDKVRGDKKYISSNLTASESTDSNTFDLVSGGFNLAGGNGWTNVSGRNYVAWNWKAGGAGSANTDGSINTTATSVNTTAGFSISTYTGTGSAATIGHGLGVKPSMIIVKNLSSSSYGWYVYHKSIAATHEILLNSSSAKDTTSQWNDTEPTSSVFSVGTAAATNGSGNNLVAYCFAEKTGYSKFGSYKGNGNADGTFVYTGFKPAFVIIKATNAGENWFICDNKREGYNAENNRLIPNLNNAEQSDSPIDILSNGFKARETSSKVNGSNEPYIYMVFGQSLVGSNNVPCTAR